MVINFDIIEDLTGFKKDELLKKPKSSREGRFNATRAMIARYLYDCGWTSKEIANFLCLAKNADRLISAHESFMVSRRGYVETYNALCSRMVAHLHKHSSQ